MVRVMGLEPTRLAAQEPKGYVTSVKESGHFRPPLTPALEQTIADILWEAC